MKVEIRGRKCALKGASKSGLFLQEKRIIQRMNKFVYGNAGRIFVNTDMGCRANCRYCYLPQLGIQYGKKKISAGEAIHLVEDLEYYCAGENGSIISIGCYSECMDAANIEDTAIVVNYFLNRDNYVQLATKKKIDKVFFDRIKNNEKYRLQIYVSLPVINDYKSVEIGTDSPEMRINNFELCMQTGIQSVLYIKPYLPGITNKSISEYIAIINKYHVPAVVGEMLSTEEKGKKTLVGENRLVGSESEEMMDFINILKSYTSVYKHSTDYLRGRCKL